MTTFQRPCRLTIYISGSSKHHHKPLLDVIVHRAQAAGLAGATVLRGIEGHGASGDVHTIRLLDVSDRLPHTVVIFDEEGKLRDFVQHNDDCVHGWLIALEALEICLPDNEITLPQPPLPDPAR